MSIHPFPVESFGLSQTTVDEVKVPLRCGDTALRFLLESVQYVDGFGVTNRIHPTPCVAPVIRDYFKYGSSAKTS